MAPQALAGVKVVELGSFIAAPYAAKLLADMGADVVKVEPPLLGDGARRYGPFPKDEPHPEKRGLFLFLNTSKRGITLDATVPTGREVLRRLLRDADILIEGLPQAAVEECSLDYPSLARDNERLIVVSVTPFGRTGPWSRYKGHAVNVAASSGLSLQIGNPDRPPLTLPLSLADFEGGVSGAIGAQLALFARRKTGRGQHVDAATLDVLTTIQRPMDLAVFLSMGRIPRRKGHHRDGHVYPHTIMRCKDGYVAVTAIEGSQWKRFLEVMGMPAWAKDPKYRDRWQLAEHYAAEVDALVEPWMLARTRDEIFAVCRENRVPFCPVLTIDEVIHHPQFQERGFLAPVEHPVAGPVTCPGAPYQFSRTPWRIGRPAPLLGQHNEEVYCGQLGYTREDLVAMRRAGVI